MPELHLVSIESKVRQVTCLSKPDEAFVTDLWERLSQQPLPSQPIFGKPSWYRRPGWIILAVLMTLLAALFIGFGPRNVSAFIREIFGRNDSGLQAVQEAGMVTELEITAQPTLSSEMELTPDLPPDVHPLFISQTLEDITVTLEWIYIDEARMTLALTSDPLPQGIAFGMPTVNLNGIGEWRGGSYRQESTTSVLIDIYQNIQVDVVGELVNFSIDLPLVNQNESEEHPYATFHFDLEDIPVYQGMNIPLTQTASVTIDGVEIQLRSVRVMPSYTEIELCYDMPPNEDSKWYMPKPTLQIDDGPVETSYGFTNLGENEGKQCARIEFSVGNADGGERLIFQVENLFIPLPEKIPAERIYAANEILAEYGLEIAPAEGDSQEGMGGWVFVETPDWDQYEEDPSLIVMYALREKMVGPWTFYIDLPGSEDFLAVEDEPTTEPITTEYIDAHTQAGITVTLDWAFVDALRIGVGYTITGLPDEPEATELSGMIYFVDALGNPIGGSGIGSSNISRVPDQPGVLQGAFSVGFLEPLTQDEASFQWITTLDGTQDNEVIAYFPLSEDAEANQPGSYPPHLPESFIGTYTFEFTAPVHPMMVLENISSTTINGLEILIPRVEISSSMSKMMFCYNKPTTGDWWIDQATIENREKETPWVSSMLVFDRDISIYPESQETTAIWETPLSIQNAEHGRCVVLNFLLGYGDLSDDLMLTVPQLEISPPEVVPEDKLAAAREILRAQGIEMAYEVWESASGGGGGGVSFPTLPTGMDWDTAYHKYLEALGYIYPGPWIFTITID